MTRSPAALLFLVVSLSALPGSGLSAAEDVRDLIAPYLRARDEGAVGEVAGETYRAPARPGGPPAPAEGISALLMPYSAKVEAALDAIKAHLRDSLKNYSESAAKVVAVRAAYERELLAAGGGELIRGEVSDAQGRLRLAEIPAGEWLLIAWREDHHPQPARKARREDATRFPDLALTAGYEAVSYWRVRVLVRPGETVSVRLTDRSVWLNAVREETKPPEVAPPGRPSRRR